MLDIDKIFRDIERLKESIAYDKALLENAKTNNAKRNKAEERYADIKELKSDVSDYRRKLLTLYAVCNDRASKYTDERKNLIESVVESNLEYLFPEERFKVKIDLDVSKKGRESCQLLLGSRVPGTSELVYSPTSAQNGRFVRQLISMVVVYSLNYYRGLDTIFFDETLSSSDKVNLTKLKPLLDRMCEDGIQVILIEHKAELYNNVTRRQFNMRKDRNTGETSIVSIKDIGGDDNEDN